MERPLVYNWKRNGPVAPLPPRGARRDGHGETLEQVDGRRLGRDTLRMALREPRKKRATYGKDGRARAQTTDDHTRDFASGTSNAAAYFIYILDCM
ncbi:MAG: hypothetical protein ACTHNZ_07595 [Trinickia sp.]|jgi:hypothetical protein|uniref:hypothetical protein n=1 Tax=Trinickia sp. TaxID=2571163 RepID=UPI003F7FEDE2